MARLGDEPLVTTTGYISREVHHERDRPENFYMQGSMGHALAIAIGVATGRPEQRVVVLDGDGALLMHLGTAALVGQGGCANLVHLVVDNGCYESTGSQPSPAGAVRWAELGRGLGYATVIECASVEGLEDAIGGALRADGPVLGVLRVCPTPTEVHPRASAAVGLDAMAERFRASLATSRGD